jgi:hypothetical protein
MDALAEAGWRTYPAIAMMLIGGLLATSGLRHEIAGLRAPFSDRDKPLRMLAGFRAAIVGVALLIFATAWLGGLAWLMWLAAIIGFGELLESSLMISGIRMGRQLEEDRRRRQRA